ncbi:hypothetical protein BDD12DRAFT_818043 [Trichophaea hybrida]|nr:hypothetical protein BDD12DRAFT_818043 [Trichophaea hybrida]
MILVPFPTEEMEVQKLCLVLFGWRLGRFLVYYNSFGHNLRQKHGYQFTCSTIRKEVVIV